MAINKNRIVPIKDIDLLTLYCMFAQLREGSSATVTVLAPKPDSVGRFELAEGIAPGGSGIGFMNEPVTSLHITSEVDAAAFYFVAAHDYEGMTCVVGAAAPAAVTVEGDEIVPDGVSLYYAEYDSGTVAITLVTPAAPEA